MKGKKYELHIIRIDYDAIGKELQKLPCWKIEASR